MAAAWESYTSTIQPWNPRAEEQYVDGLLFCFCGLAHLIYNSDQAHVRFYEYVLALGIECSALGDNSVSSVLGTACKVSAWLAGSFCELFES